MTKPIKHIVFIVGLCTLLTSKMFGFTPSEPIAKRVFQIDSLIREKSINNDMTQLELLILYQDAWAQRHPDSLTVIKNLALLNAELEQPEDAKIFTEKYIRNTLDFSILKNNAYNAIKETDEYDFLHKKYMTRITTLSFVFLYVALIGFFFTVLINFTKKSNVYSKFFVSGFVCIHSFFILEFVLYISNYQYNYPHTYLIASVAALLYGPFLYFYFKSVTTTNFKLRIIDLLHLFPTFVLMVFLFPMYMLPSDEKLKIMLEINHDYDINRYVIFVSKVLSLFIYAIFIGKLHYAYRKRCKDDQTINKRNCIIYYIHIIYLISYVIYGLPVSGLLEDFPYFINYMQVSIMCIMVIYLVFIAFVQPEILKNETTVLTEFKKYEKSGLTNALSEELKENLIRLFMEDKVFKENNINLEVLSDKLNTTRHNTSQIINEHFRMNFFELINKFRIQEAANMFENDVHGSLNIIDVAYEVGYNNKVTFNKAFKKEMSVTPSEYIQTQIRNSNR